MRIECPCCTCACSTTAIEASLARLCDGLLWIDDTEQTQNHAVLKTLAYQVAGNTGRARGDRTGGIRPLAHWRAVAFISGERPILSLGLPAGARNRTLEINAEPPSGEDVAREVHEQLAIHHGWTGPEFVAALIDRFVVQDRLHELSDEFQSFRRAVAGGAPIDEASDHVALLATADYLARVLVWGEDESDARVAAVRMGTWLLAMARLGKSQTVDRAETAYDSILGFIAEHEHLMGFGRSGTPQIGAIHPELVDGQRVALLLPGPLNAFARRDDFDLQAALHSLRRDGLLITNEDGRLKRRAPRSLFGASRPRLYWLVLEDDDDTET